MLGLSGRGLFRCCAPSRTTSRLFMPLQPSVTANRYFGKKSALTEEEQRAFQTHPILKRVPKFLRSYTRNFINAPVSHVTAFVILHELSAVVPLVGIWYIIHNYNFGIPLDLPSWAIEKGTKIIDSSLKSFDFSTFTLEDKAKFILEGAYSYAIVKSLFPLRIGFSLFFMPTFAKYFVVPFTRIFRFRKHRKVPEAKPGIGSSTEKEEIKKLKKPRL
ncbi:Piso0_004013 [Millerozyma farinosa CBS 7064]|uniref:Piso0_004013 protein n=1 Tax=Pichia sorbitophila (strain ATCC MYA-4447 / BCRC 22081 / CBS 7064 / NBRC 10061 / NRRL Y-12695) TaxID=559304 RepID=G8Y789_PICSO|nr:Piso0_004013 [Millerozyma farinosa CBS 7064]CCE84469.1 Piso0_004013 [Millerozyma farinosa CBS 7064]